MFKQIALAITVLLSFSTVASIELTRIGSKYGGWIIPKHLLHEHSICYCVGAGLDISFDIGIAQTYNCTVHIFDPTPRAIAHFKDAIDALKHHTQTYSTPDKFPYTLDISKIHNLIFHSIGVWSRDETLKFYVPKNMNHISHSITNLQKTNDFFEAPCKQLSSIMKELNHTSIDLLKLDIEGAEYAVIDNIIKENIAIRCMCIEFHKSPQHASRAPLRTDADFKHCLEILTEQGYRMIDESEFPNMVFLNDVQ